MLDEDGKYYYSVDSRGADWEEGTDEVDTAAGGTCNMIRFPEDIEPSPSTGIDMLV